MVRLILGWIAASERVARARARRLSQDGCRRPVGSMAVQNGGSLDLTSTFKAQHGGARGSPLCGASPAGVHRISDAVAVVSLVIDPGEVLGLGVRPGGSRQRADPAGAGLALLRTRLNLPAVAAGVKPEVDLWPHLRGVSACILADSGKPGDDRRAAYVAPRPGSNAERLVLEFGPALGGFVLAPGKWGRHPAPRHPGRTGRPSVRPGAGSGDPHPAQRLGVSLPLHAERGDDHASHDGWVMLSARHRLATRSTVMIAQPKPRRLGRARCPTSVAAVCGGWASEGRAPGVSAHSGLVGSGARLAAGTAARRPRSRRPPAVWWGWSNQAHAQIAPCPTCPHTALHAPGRLLAAPEGHD